MSNEEPLIEIPDSSTIHQPIRGLAKSGRKWKHVETSRFSALKTDKAFKSSWSKKEHLRREKAETKLIAQNLKEGRQRIFDDKKRLRLEKETRRKENERKAEVVQVVKNAHKLKRMKKKALRKLEKRDTTVVQKS